MEEGIAPNFGHQCLTGKCIAEVKHILLVRKEINCVIHYHLNCLKYEAFFSHSKLSYKSRGFLYESLEGMKCDF
jgi:hypothetical protein